MADDAPDAAPDEAPAPDAEQAEAPSDADKGASEPTKPGEQPKGARDYSRMFAALSRKEKAIREREGSFEKAQAQAAAERRELETFRALRQQARQNPKAWLEAGALDQQTLQQAFAPSAKPDEDARSRAYEAKLARLEAQIAERDQKYQKMAAEQAKARYVDNIHRVIDADPAAYELLKAEGRQADVYELMDRHYQEHQEVLPIDKACAALEAALEEQLTTQAKRYRGYKKLAPRLGWQSQPEDQPGDTAPAAPPPSTRKTPPPRKAAQPASSRKPATPAGKRDLEAEWAEKVRRYERG